MTKTKRKPQTPVRSTRLVRRLRLQLAHMVWRSDYVCVHRYGPSDPVGTRMIAVQDLAQEAQRARELLIETQTPEDSEEEDHYIATPNAPAQRPPAKDV